MQLFFRALRPGEAPLLLCAVAALAAQFLSTRLALAGMALLVMHVEGARRMHDLAWLLGLLLAFVLVPIDGSGPTLWTLAVDALAITLEVACRDDRARPALVLAVLLARPGADTVVWRAMKVCAALALGVLLRDGGHPAMLRVLLVLLLGPLHAVYGVFECCRLMSAQTDAVHY